MVWVLILLLSIIMVLLVRSSGTASIEFPMNSSYILDSPSASSFMNTTENEYLRGMMILESNQTTNNYLNEGIIVSEINDHDLNMNISDFIIPSPPPNITCTRRDYSGDIGAVFKKKPGPIEDAFIVFNTTYSSFAMGRIHNTTELIDLKVLNETIVNCSEYSTTISRRLNIFTQYSLAG